MKEGAVDPFDGWHFNAAGYLKSWQRMCKVTEEKIL